MPDLYRYRYWVAGGVIGAALLVGGLLGAAITSSRGQRIPLFVAAENSLVRGGDVSFENGFTPMVQKVVPAVVNIFSSRIVRSQDTPANPFLNDPFFRRFFGEDFGPWFNVPRERRERSLGSGVIVSPDGYLQALLLHKIGILD